MKAERNIKKIKTFKKVWAAVQFKRQINSGNIFMRKKLGSCNT